MILTTIPHRTSYKTVFSLFLLAIHVLLIDYAVYGEERQETSLFESYLNDLSQVDYELKNTLTKNIKKKIAANPDSVHEYVSAENYLVKVCFIRAVTELNRPADYNELVPFLDDSETGVVLETVRALGVSQNARFAKPLEAKCTLKENDESIVCAALLALGELAYTGSSKFIYDIYTAPTASHTVKYHALLALGRSGEKPASEKLLTLYPTASENSKNLILRLLGNFRTVPAVIEFLDTILKTTSDNQKQALTLVSLGKLESEAHFDVFIEYLQNDNDQLFHAAIKALGYLGNAQAIYPLFKALSERLNFENQERIYDAIEKICALYTLEEIQSHLASLDHPARIITQLASLGDPSSVTILRELLYHDDPINRIFAIDALTKSASPNTAKKLLIQRLSKATPIDLAVMLPIFSRWHRESLVSYTDLSGVQHSSIPSESLTVCKAMLKEPDSLPHLIEIIRNERSAFRWCAVLALQNQEISDETMRLIIHSLKHGSLVQRFYAARTLSLLAQQDASLETTIHSFLEVEQNSKVIDELKQGIAQE